MSNWRAHKFYCLNTINKINRDYNDYNDEQFEKIKKSFNKEANKIINNKKSKFKQQEN